MPGSNHKATRRGLGLLLFLWLQALLFYVHLSDFGHVAFTIAAGLLWWRIGAARFALLLGSSTLCLGFLEAASRLSPPANVGGQDALTAGRRYLPDRTVEFDLAYGNLRSVGGPAADAIAVPRVARWVTDARGYRNSRFIERPELVVIGDSFIAAVGSSQEDVVTEQLRRDFDIEAISLGHPGNLRRYWSTVETNPDVFTPPADPKLFVFVFEGNDFGDDSPEPWRWATRRTKRRDPVVAFYRQRFTSFGTLNRMWARLFAPPPESRVRLDEAAGHPIGFFREYDLVTARTAYTFPPKVARAVERLAGRADAFFFIPTKSRVYEPWIQPDDPLPNAQWDALAAAVRDDPDTVLVDLTPALRERAAQLLPKGEFVFWPDDTHWNGAGMRVAAEQAAAVYRALVADDGTTP